MRSEIKREIHNIGVRWDLGSVGEIRRRGMEDLHFLVSEILYSESRGFDKLGKFHKYVCEHIEGNKDYLLLIPRGHWKTTIGTIGDSIRLMLIDPNIRLLIASATMENCIKIINEIKAHFESNELFRAIYKDYIWTDFNKASKWSATKMDISAKRRYGGEATVEIASVGTEVTGRHYDCIKYDDIVAKENSETDGQRRMVTDWYKKSLALLNPRPYNMKHIIGTRWNADDMYRGVIERGRYIRMVLGCYDDNGEPIFPERFTKEYLEELKRELGTYDFSCLYLNDPIPDELQIIKKEWVKLYKDKPKIIKRYITIDPAISEGNKSDETAICVGGIDNSRIIYIEELWHGRVGVDKLIEQIIRMIVLWKPDKVGIEDVAFQRTLKYSLERIMRAKGLWCEIKPLRGYTKSSKDIRIKRIIPFMERGQIMFNRNLNDLFEQMYRWRGKKNDKDDMLDALAYMIELADDFAIVYNSEEADELYDKEVNEIMYNGRRRRRLEYDDYKYGSMYEYTSY